MTSVPAGNVRLYLSQQDAELAQTVLDDFVRTHSGDGHKLDLVLRAERLSKRLNRLRGLLPL